NVSLTLVDKNAPPPPPSPAPTSTSTPPSPPPTSPSSTTTSPSPTTTSPSSTTPSQPSPSPAPAPTTTSAAKPAKPSLKLACAGKTMIATLKPANGTKVSSVWFYANGKIKAKDRRAPFVAAIPTKGLNLPLKIAVAIQASGKSTFVRTQHRGC